MDLARLTAFVRGPRALLVLMAAVAAVVALGVSLAQPERFRATAEVWFGRTTDATSLVADEAGVATAAEAQAANLALATLDTAAARVKRRFPGPGSVEDLKRAVDVRFKRNSDLVTVTAERSEPARAALVANAFAEEIVALRRETAQAEVQHAIDVLSQRDEIRSLTARVARLELLKALQTGDVQIVERAVPPPNPSSPKPLRNALLASFVGLIAGILGLALRTRLDDRLRDEHELASLIPATVLARIPQARITRVGSAHHDPAFTDAFQFLSMQLHLLRPHKGGLVLTVTSPAEGDGKTTVVSWLAHSLAVSGADARVVSSAEAAAPGPGMIDPERLRHMFGVMREEADFVLLDAAAVSTVADASLVAGAADGVILVIDLDRTRRKELLAAKRQLANARATLVGVVLNRTRASVPAYVPPERAGVKSDPAGQFGPPTFTA